MCIRDRDEGEPGRRHRGRRRQDHHQFPARDDARAGRLPRGAAAAARRRTARPPGRGGGQSLRSLSDDVRRGTLQMHGASRATASSESDASHKRPCNGSARLRTGLAPRMMRRAERTPGAERNADRSAVGRKAAWRASPMTEAPSDGSPAVRLRRERVGCQIAPRSSTRPGSVTSSRRVAHRLRRPRM